MAEYDLVIRNTTIATAADVVKGDIGISGGRVVALGERLDKGRKEIDATGLIAVPGGIDAHVHFDQDTADGSVFCDDFESGSRAAAAGGTTTIIPFAYQNKGQPLRDAVNKYHKRAEGKSLIDYAFHVILSDASHKIMGQDFTALVADGYTSFKVYMTYDDVKLTDREMLDAAWDALGLGVTSWWRLWKSPGPPDIPDARSRSALSPRPVPRAAE